MRLYKIFTIFYVLFIFVMGVYYLYKGYSLLILLILIIPFVVVFIHELGHMIFGFILGYKFVLIQAAGFLIYREDNKIKFNFSPISLFWGQCLMLPQNDKGRYILYYLGGNIMNIICGIILLILIFVLDLDYTIFTFILLISQFGIGLINMIPITALGIPNDTMVVFKSLQSKEASQGIYLLQYELNNRINGNRMSNLDDKLFAMNDTVDVNNFIIAQVIIIEAKRLYDIGEYEKSFEQYNRLNVKKLPVYLQVPVYNNLIYYYIVHNPDYEKAKKYLMIKKRKNISICEAYAHMSFI